MRLPVTCSPSPSACAARCPRSSSNRVAFRVSSATSLGCHAQRGASQERPRRARRLGHRNPGDGLMNELTTRCEPREIELGRAVLHAAYRATLATRHHALLSETLPRFWPRTTTRRTCGPSRARLRKTLDYRGAMQRGRGLPNNVPGYTWEVRRCLRDETQRREESHEHVGNRDPSSWQWDGFRASMR